MPLWLCLGFAGVLVYRAAMASLLQAHHALPSLQRRRLLEERSIANPALATLLARPHLLGLGVTLWNQLLLMVLLILVWPMAVLLPSGGWFLLPCALVYVWLMDLALPTLLTAASPAAWMQRLFPLYAPVHPLMALLVGPLERRMAQRQEDLERAREEEPEPAAEEAVTALLEEGEAEGILEEEDRELIRNVVGFGDTVVREVMTPRTRIQALPIHATMAEAWALFREGRHSRLPLYDGSIDQIEGVLLLKDLMQRSEDSPLEPLSLAKQPLFVPESKPTLELLRELQRARTQLAVVVDEYGTVSGIVTIEDLLEEVFGEIREEHEAQQEIQALGPDEYLISGQLHVEDLEERLGIPFEREGFDTLAGLVMAHLGHVPKPGESVDVEGMRFKVLRMDGARIQQVHARRLPEAPAEHGSDVY